jgi:hypothetical protein
MKKFFPILAFLLATSARGQYPFVVQSASGNTTCSTNSNVTSGDVMFIQVFGANASAPIVFSVTSDTRSSSWTNIYTKSYSATGQPNDGTALFSAPMGSSGAESIVVAGTNSPAQLTSLCWEENLAGLTFSLDGTPSVNEGGATATLGTGNTTTAVNGSLLISGAWEQLPSRIRAMRRARRFLATAPGLSI